MRHLALASILALGAAVAFALSPSEARATGGLLVTADDAGEVTAREHRVVLSVSDEQTSLWDDLAYAGEPADLAWILPVQGPAEIAESSTSVTRILDEISSVAAHSPYIACCDFMHCDDNIQETEVLSPPLLDRPVAEPYEVERIAAADAGALATWLAESGYVVTDEVSALLDDYATRGFDFLTVRFAPDAEVKDTRPIRVTMPGRHDTLPIRMLRAGAGEAVATTLWVLSAEPLAPEPWFRIDEDELVWDWDSGTTNHGELVEAGRAEAGEGSWLLEMVLPLDDFYLRLIGDQSAGYRGTGEERIAAAEADLEALVGPLRDGPRLFAMTRLRAEVTPAAAIDDVTLDTVPFTEAFNPVAASAVGDPPPCPPQPQNPGGGQGSPDDAEGGGAPVDEGAGGADAAAPTGGGDDGGCSLGGPPAGGGGAIASALALLGLLAARGRRRSAA